MAIGWVDLDAKDIEVGTVETIVVFLDTHLLGVCGYGLTCGLCPCMPLYPHLPRLQPAPVHSVNEAAVGSDDYAVDSVDESLGSGNTNTRANYIPIRKWTGNHKVCCRRRIGTTIELSTM